MIDRFNLLFHLTPFLANDIWMRNCFEVLKRIDLFNGKIVVGVAEGEGIVSPEVIARIFEPFGAEVFAVQNSVRYREFVTFPRLIESAYSKNANESTFYCHSKGVSSSGKLRGDAATTYWRNTMYCCCLDQMDVVCDLLKTYACVGTHRIGPMDGKLRGGKFEHAPGKWTTNRYRWHFAGTIFWYRNDHFYGNRLWKNFLQTGWGAEAHLGHIFRYQDGACLAFDHWATRNDNQDPQQFGLPIEDDPRYKELERYLV